MNNEVETSPTTIGIFRVPRYKSEAGNKALAIFTKMKRKVEQVPPRSSAHYESGQVQPIQELQPSHEEMQYRAMNSYRLQDEVVKTDHGFEVG